MAKILFNGKEYIAFHAAMDKNGNKVAKVFYTDGTTEIIRDARLPLTSDLTSDKFYNSLSSLYRSKLQAKY